MTDAICSRAIAYLKANMPDQPADLESSELESPVVTNLGNGLLVEYLVDQGTYFQYVQKRDLADARCNEDALYESGLKNLATLLRNAEPRVVRQSNEAVHAVFFDRNFEASLILVDELWEKRLAHLAPNGFIAAIPNRHVLAFCDARSEAGVSELRQIVAGTKGEDHALTTMLYRRDPALRSWRPYAIAPGAMQVLPTTDLDEFAARVREHYLEQFRAFISGQKRDCIRGASEVKLKLSDKSGLFQNLCCLDFIKNDGKPEILELEPCRVLRSKLISGSLGRANLQVEDLQWNDVKIQHDRLKPLSGLNTWFEQWFDTEDKRYDKDAELCEVIHSLLVEPDRLSIDFGSAPVTALSELLNLLEQEGAKNICVSSSQREAEHA